MLDIDYSDISPASAVMNSRVADHKDEKTKSTRETRTTNIIAHTHEAINTAIGRQ